jgi:hypothetical protein
MVRTAPAAISSIRETTGQTKATVVAFERHFSAQDLAEFWKLDETTIRRIFQDQPGVFKVGRSNRRDGKRDYVTLRIPESIALRVYQERTRC